MALETALSTENLSYRYPSSDRHVLDGVTLSVRSHECVGLIGPNGAGKTTLFLCLAGVLPTRRGMINVGGLDPSDPEDRQAIPRKLGIVFQNSDDQLFSPSVFDDVAFGPLNLGLDPEEVKRRVSAALAAVGMAGKEDAVPFHLSGGEKRRVALAGVLAMRPEILLLDEPTMFLDPRGRREFLRLLREIGATKVIATHDLELVRQVCNRVVLIDEGRLICEGIPDRVLGNAELMERHGLEVPHSLRQMVKKV